MASSSNSKSSRSERFNEYLNNLNEAFKSNATSMTSPSARRFNIYLGYLKCEFELLSLEIETLGIGERDEKKAKVENGRPNICDRCGNEITSASQIGVSSGATSMKKTLSLFSRPFFQFKSRDKPSTSRRVDLTEKTAITQKPRLAISPTSQSVSYSRLSDSTLKFQRKWSIAYNTEVEKELVVELAHQFGHTKAISHTKFSKDGERLAVGCSDGKVYIYDVETGILTCVLGNLLTGDECIGAALCFSGDGNYLATSALNGNTYIWEIKIKFVQKAFRGHISHSMSLEFSPNDRLLLSASYDNSVRLWNMRDGSSKFLTEHNPTFIDGPNYRGANFNPDGKFVAALHRDGIARIWDVRTGRLIRRVMSHSFGRGGITFMPDGKGLVSGGANWKGDGATLKSWDISSLNATRFHARMQRTNGLSGHVSGLEEQTKPERIFSGHERGITSLAISCDGKWIASGSYDNSVRIWNTSNAMVQCTLNNAHEGAVFVDFSPAGVHLASGGDDGEVRIWKYTYTRCGASRVHIGH